MNALILVDIQNDFMPGGALAVEGGHEIIPLINRLQQSFSLVVASQDWHPAGHKSFASSHHGKKPFDEIVLGDLLQVLWPDHCVQTTRGSAFRDSLDLRHVEGIFRKGMDPEIDSYSAFYDNGHRKSTGLSGYLHERGIKKVFVCGLAADYCVYYTAKDALKENFETYLIADATRPISSDGFEKAKEDLMRRGGKVVQSDEI